MGDIPALEGGRDPVTSPRRLGIYGGSFDPVHRGHLFVAHDVRESFALDRVVLVPANRSPFKADAGASGAHRFEMLRFAINGLPWADASDVELGRPAPSYTVDTVRHFRECLPDTELFLIVGADTLKDFSGWRDPDGILDLATLIAVARPGSTLGLPKSLANLIARRQTRIVLHHAASPDTSSREVRARVRQGLPVDGHVPEQVARYIQKCGLYREPRGE